MKTLKLFLQLSRPLYNLLALLVYILGAGIARYLSGQVNWLAFFMGFAWVLVLLLGFQFINEYFYPETIFSDTNAKHTPFSGPTGAIGKDKLSRLAAFWAGLTCLAITASLTVLILYNLHINLAGIVFLAVILLGELILTLPPFRLVVSGYGEIIYSIVNIALIPAWAFLLQGREFHRLLIMVAFPLTILFLSMLLAMEFPDYAQDILQEKKPLIVRIGWQKAMQLHNILILSGFVVLGMAFALHLPLKVGWPVFFALPAGLYQIWMMNRIGEGAKPNWDLLVLVASATFVLAAYLLAFAFWTH